MKKLSFFIVAVMLVSILLVSGKAYAQQSYYNNYYLGLNGGIVESTPSGTSSKSGGTYNLTLGKNFNMSNIVIGGGVLLGYADNGTWYSTSVDSVYYGAFVKGGYAFNNIMPFVKLGYIGTSFNGSNGAGNQTEGGLLYGLGIAYMINPNLGITAQYFGTSLSGGNDNGIPNFRVNNYTIGVDFNF